MVRRGVIEEVDRGYPSSPMPSTKESPWHGLCPARAGLCSAYQGCSSGEWNTASQRVLRQRNNATSTRRPGTAGYLAELLSVEVSSAARLLG